VESTETDYLFAYGKVRRKELDEMSAVARESDPYRVPQMTSERASALVNPASGLANDYLNLFNEIVMLIEQLPVMPDLIQDILAWHPVSYADYFSASSLPERHLALEAYTDLDAEFRTSFETVVGELDQKAVGAVAAIRRMYKASGEVDQDLADICARASESLRKTLLKATTLVNHGTRRGRETPQHRVDRLLNLNARKAG
jgi:hypothetical protein